MNLLIPENELRAAHEKYLREHPKPKSKSDILCEIVAQEPGRYTVRELAEAAEHSVSWVRRTLKLAGLSEAVKSARKRKETSEL